MLMLLIMVSGSTWWLNSAAQSVRLPSSQQHYLKADHWALIHARQSLLSYASLYPYLYGPAGAGPGHLPCPDTDSQNTRALRHPFVGDSPNPPCGSSTHASGRLPRHVSLPRYRYAFHNEPFQRFSYSVYSHVVNNPINRRINPSLLSTAHGRNALAATIQSGGEAPASGSGRKFATRITNAALLKALKPAVAAWILDVVQRSVHGACRTQAQHKSVQPMTESKESDFSEILLLLVDQLPEGDSCISTDPGVSTIEQIAINRHWFVRNQWHEWVQIETSEDCASELIHCSLVYQTDNAARDPLLQSQKLVLRWQPGTGTR